MTTRDGVKGTLQAWFNLIFLSTDPLLAELGTDPRSWPEHLCLVKEMSF